MNKVTKWITHKSELILQGKIFRYHKIQRESKESGLKGEFDIIQCLNWVNIIAVTKENKIILVKQYRHGNDQVTLETPGGAIDLNEDTLVAAKRELEEETGYVSDKWEKLGETFVNPAFMTNKIHAYMALDCDATGRQSLDQFEEVEIELRPLEQLHELVLNGEINHTIVQNSLYLYLLNKLNYQL